MGDVGLKQLYMAKSISELNSEVQDIPKASTKMLIKAAQKVLKEAQLVDQRKDEEKAYVLYMRYFSIVLAIQKDDEYKSNKKYYDGLLDPKTTKKVITRAEELQKSLDRRYEFRSSAKKADKDAEDRKVVEKLEKEKEARLKAEHASQAAKSAATTNASVPIFVENLRLLLDPHLSNAAEKLSDYLLSNILLRVEESVSASEVLPTKSEGVTEEGIISCQKLYSLSKEKCSSFMILDVRPHDHFLESQMKLPNVISIPEERLKPGLTAGKIGSELEESSRALWVSLRDKVDYLIVCDWFTEQPPFPPPMVVLMDAIVKWDPNKQYKSRPLVLKGGYDLWRLMYPISTTNPKVEVPTMRKGAKPDPISFNFEYPDLDTAFINTPSPSSQPSTTIPEVRSTPPAAPTINRYLKPSLGNKESLDGKNNNFNNTPEVPQINNNASIREGSPAKISIGSKVNSWDTKDSNKALDLAKSKQNLQPTDKTENVPLMPSRLLKPKDLLESLVAKKVEMEQEQELLEESVKIEEDTMEKIKEMEETTLKREMARDEQSRTQLQQTEDRLQEEIRRLKAASSDMEERYEKIHKQNEELWKMVKLALSGNLSNVDLGSTTPLNNATDVREQQEQEELRAQEDKRKSLEEQVERMRRERKEKERKMKEQAEKEKKAKELAEVERRQAEERKSRLEAEQRSQRNKGGSGTGETYTTKLRDSPRSSPVRGGSNLKRSHSAFNLSQLGDDEKVTHRSPVTNIDRSLKPLNAPQRRNINAARQRNFEPKYGNVGHARTGLKNLGNTCYMNSIIQCLNNSTALAKYFVEGLYSDDINTNSKYRGDVAEEMGAVFRALWCGQYRSISMWDLKNTVGRLHKPFQGYDQHDSHEFLIKLMDWLHEDLNKITGKKMPMKEQNYDDIPDYVAAEKMQEELRRRDDSIVCSLFHGLHRSVIECDTCSHRSLTFEPFSIIPLSFPSSGRCTLKELLQHYYKESRIEYKCSKCKRLRSCVRKLDIWKLPPVLILHLNRFEHDVLMRKKQNFVDFPLENLDLGKHTALKNNRYENFDLYGVSNHYGTMDGGHYTAFCKSSVNKLWYKFDDHEVYELSRENVRSSAAYLLFYEASNMNVKVNNLI